MEVTKKGVRGRVQLYQVTVLLSSAPQIGPVSPFHFDISVWSRFHYLHFTTKDGRLREAWRQDGKNRSVETCLCRHCQMFWLSRVLYKPTLYQRALICRVATHSGLRLSDFFRPGLRLVSLVSSTSFLSPKDSSRDNVFIVRLFSCHKMGTLLLPRSQRGGHKELVRLCT